MASERFSVSWDDFHKNMSLGVHSLLEKEDFVDVTLAVEGRYLKAHKIVLSVCSPYFRELFRTSPCKHPIVFMKDVSYIVMSDLLQFMYQGEVQISKENFNIFLKTAESLQISGLSNYSNGIPGRGGDKVLKPPDPEICNSQKETRETPLSPPLKRIHLNKSHAPLQHEVVKTEPEAIPYHAGEELIMLKTEPEEPNTTTMEDNVSENFFEDSQEGANMDDMNDWMMEGEDGEPQASTSTDLTLGDDLAKLEPQTFASVTLLLPVENSHNNVTESEMEPILLTKTRSKNFTATEVSVLVDEVEKHRNDLFGNVKEPYITRHYNREKAWRQVASAVNAVAPVTRKLEDIKKKFRDIKSRTKQKMIMSIKMGGNVPYGYFTAAEERLTSFIVISKDSTEEDLTKIDKLIGKS